MTLGEFVAGYVSAMKVYSANPTLLKKDAGYDWMVGELKKRVGEKINRSTVRNMITKHVRLSGDRPRCILDKKHLNKLKHATKPKIIDKCLENKMIKYLQKYRGWRQVTATTLKKKFKLKCTNQTIINMLDNNDIHWRVRRKKTSITRLQKDRRLKWSRKIARWPQSKLDRIVCADGTTCSIPLSYKQQHERATKSKGSHVYRKATEGPYQTKIVEWKKKNQYIRIKSTLRFGYIVNHKQIEIRQWRESQFVYDLLYNQNRRVENLAPK